MENNNPDRLSIYITRIFGILLIIFGFIGFYAGRSLISLMSGVFFGVVLLGCTMGMKKNPRGYTFGALALITILMASFFFRALVSHKIIPTIFGAASLSVFLILFFRRARS